MSEKLQRTSQAKGGSGGDSFWPGFAIHGCADGVVPLWKDQPSMANLAMRGAWWNEVQDLSRQCMIARNSPHN